MCHIITSRRTPVHAFPSRYVFLPCIITVFLRSSGSSHIIICKFMYRPPSRTWTEYRCISPTITRKRWGEIWQRVTSVSVFWATNENISEWRQIKNFEDTTWSASVSSASRASSSSRFLPGFEGDDGVRSHKCNAPSSPPVTRQPKTSSSRSERTIPS